MTKRILIVDDRTVVRNELRKLLNLTETICVVGEAVDGRDALRQAKALKPDIVLMDLEMPVMDGFEATRQIKTLNLAQTVIVFTVYADPSFQQKALEAGADGYIVKGTNLQSMLELFDQFSDRHIDVPDSLGMS